ncbi:MAG: hypothetical protein PGN27_20010 [Mycolicibacterium neoaurum]|uniref:hypothetical protein n=1 Tax=Mycolicibacterium neoaurum TaxID=1795 RepID=UPI002FFBBB0B
MKNTMMTRMTAGAAMSGALLLFGGAAVAAAQPEDGKIDVSIGTAGVLTNVPVTTAAQIAADLCKTDLGDVTVTAESVDTAGAQQSACTTATVGQVDFRQNGQQPDEAATPATAEGASYSEEPVQTDEPVNDEATAGSTDEAPETTVTPVPQPEPAG